MALQEYKEELVERMAYLRKRINGVPKDIHNAKLYNRLSTLKSIYDDVRRTLNKENNKGE